MHRSAFRSLTRPSTQKAKHNLNEPDSLSEPRDNSGGTFGLLVTSENDVWGKIYRYEFIETRE